jgi:wyosine [tRNA(Phe)-imidazoG37] synthetase (radical SAM superfamily)
MSTPSLCCPAGPHLRCSSQRETEDLSATPHPIRNARCQWFWDLTSEAQRFRIAAGLPLESPVIVEVHPYHESQRVPCNNDCGHCTKGDDRSRLNVRGVEGIDPDRLISFIANLAGRGTKAVVLSGNSTEPLLYPRIDDVIRSVKAAGLALRVFSNFYYGERLLEVVSHLTRHDLLRISLDAASPATYDQVHRPRARRAFERILENIEALAEQRKRERRQFVIEITYLLNRANCGLDDLFSLVRWATERRVDRLRFSLPLRPEIGNDKFDDRQLLGEQETNVLIRLLRQLQAELGGGATVIEILDDPSVQSRKPFRACHHWKMIAVLGACGRFFPCTAVALASMMDRLGQGDINDPNLNFWELWADSRKWAHLDPASCASGLPAECTRFEFVVNNEIDCIAGREL